MLLALVRSEVARELGLASADEVAPDRSLLELGLTSLMAVEIRARLGVRVGAALPAALLFEFPTAAKAAARILSQIGPQLGSQLGLGATPAAPAPPVDEPLGRLVRQAYEREQLALGWQLVGVAAQIRAKADGILPASAPVRLCAGERQPHLVCFPALAVPTGPIQYARFAASLRERRAVTALPNPGFAGEPLPTEAAAVIAAHAEAVRRAAAGGPFALAGISSGGWIAHAVAAELERSGLFPSAVVLLDSYLPKAIAPDFEQALQREWMEWLPEIPRRDDELTAMSWYFRLFAEWMPAPIAAPTLLVRANEPLTGVDPDGDWRSRWPLPHVAVDVPGNHFTMMERHAAATAAAVDDWLAANASATDVEPLLRSAHPRRSR
jgi:thioesterase domain-containing protein/acyl carrier protein